MQQPHENWTEYDWETALRESDAAAREYLRLLKRFSDLPSADELIARHMGPDFDPYVLDIDPSSDFVLGDWGDDGESADDGADKPDADDLGEFNENEQTLFYETDPVFVTLRQNALGWCNVYAAILPRAAGERGLRVLFHLGRALGNLAYSIDDGAYESPASSVAFAKRSLASLNLALGELDVLIQENRRLHKILKTMRKHFIECVDKLVDHLHHCRERMTNDGHRPE